MSTHPQHPARTAWHGDNEVPTLLTVEEIVFATRSAWQPLRETARHFLGLPITAPARRLAREGFKYCSECYDEKPLRDFYDDNRTRDGKYSACKSCHKRRMSNSRRLA